MRSDRRFPLILAGAGHSHLVTLHSWRARGFRPPAGTLLISPETHAWYSGLMPGMVAGRFAKERCAVDLQPWCKALGIELQVDSVTALETADQRLQLASGTSITYRLLSLNVGALNPGPERDDGSVQRIPAKPFAGFAAAWSGWQKQAPARLAVLGGGPAAFELGLALRRTLPSTRIHLVSGSPLLSGHPAGLQQRARQMLAGRGIGLIEGERVDAIFAGCLRSGARQLLEVDALVLASGASAPDWLGRSGLVCDDQGFARIDPSLRSLSHGNVLLSGDCASLPGAQRSGAYAVRQGDILAHNLKALIDDGPLRIYQPQPRALALLSTADGDALASYGPLSFAGRLAGRLKDYLDLRFIRKHSLIEGRALADTN